MNKSEIKENGQIYIMWCHGYYKGRKTKTKWSEERKQYMSEKMKGCHLSEETKKS